MAGAPAGAGFVAQLAFVAFVIWLGYEIYSNAQTNLQAQRIATGFGFMQNTAGFGVSQNLIPYQESTATRASSSSAC